MSQGRSEEAFSDPCGTCDNERETLFDPVTGAELKQALF